MQRKSTGMIIGLIVFLAGGALLARGSTASMAVGTTFAIAGLGLMGWSWLRASDA